MAFYNTTVLGSSAFDWREKKVAVQLMLNCASVLVMLDHLGIKLAATQATYFHGRASQDLGLLAV